MWFQTSCLWSSFLYRLGILSSSCCLYFWYLLHMFSACNVVCELMFEPKMYLPRTILDKMLDYEFFFEGGTPHNATKQSTRPCFQTAADFATRTRTCREWDMWTHVWCTTHWATSSPEVCSVHDVYFIVILTSWHTVCDCISQGLVQWVLVCRVGCGCMFIRAWYRSDN